MSVVVKFFKKGEPHPPGRGVLASSYNELDAIRYLQTRGGYYSGSKQMFLSKVPSNKGIKVVEDAWIMVWEDDEPQENEFGVICP